MSNKEKKQHQNKQNNTRKVIKKTSEDKKGLVRTEKDQ